MFVKNMSVKNMARRKIITDGLCFLYKSILNIYHSKVDALQYD